MQCLAVSIDFPGIHKNQHITISACTSVAILSQRCVALPHSFVFRHGIRGLAKPFAGHDNGVGFAIIREFEHRHRLHARGLTCEVFVVRVPEVQEILAANGGCTSRQLVLVQGEFELVRGNHGKAAFEHEAQTVVGELICRAADGVVSETAETASWSEKASRAGKFFIILCRR